MQVRARNIEKSFGKLKILKGVNLDVEPNEMIAITGKSGAGKSTLLHILSTLDNFDSGDLKIMDQNPSSMNERSIARFRNQNLGFIFQFHHLLKEFTAIENVMMPLLIKNESRVKAEKMSKEMLAYVGLDHRFNHQPNQLSGGEQQRVAIARALVNNPGVIFADEPTGNLDDENSLTVFKLFEKIKQDQISIFVIVTHDKTFDQLCDRLLNLSNGILQK